jgi:ADP-ribose pyrophosphatase
MPTNEEAAAISITPAEAAPTETAPVEAPIIAPVEASPAPAAKTKAARPKAAKPRAARASKPKAVKAAKAPVAKKAAKAAAVKAKPTARKAKAVAVKTKAKVAVAKPHVKTAKVAAKQVKAEKTKTKLKSGLKAGKAKKQQKTPKATSPEKARLLSSKVVYQGPLFRVLHDKIIEPGGKRNERDVIRHNGSVVILAIDPSKNKKNPWVVVERQYRHAANQYLWELPAGKLDAGEDPIEGAMRELAEETGYSAKKWKPLVEYYASPGFLGESMKVFLAEGLIAGQARPEDDEEIEFRLVKFSDLVKMIEDGKIIDGKTLSSVLLYARKLAAKRKK